MAAFCAACERPIAKGEKFTVIQTEVFHRACVSNSSQSILTRTKIALLRARQAVNDQAHADALRIRIRELEDEVERWKRDRNTQYGIAAHAEEALSMARVQLSRAASDTIVERSRANSAEHLLAEQLQENAILHTEIRNLRTPPKSPTETAPAKPTSDLDDMSIRYSLLELDIPK